MKTNARHHIGLGPVSGRVENRRGSAGEILRAWLAAANCVLTQVYRVYSQAHDLYPTGVIRSLKLKRGAVLNLTRNGIRRLQMQSGIAWLTGTPDGQDVLLHAGDAFVLADPGPFVIEALSDFEIVLQS